MSNEPELKPCPFCGGEFTDNDWSQTGGWWLLYCKKCGVLQQGQTREAVTKAWNTRAADATVAELREAIREVKLAFGCDYDDPIWNGMCPTLGKVWRKMQEETKG